MEAITDAAGRATLRDVPGGPIDLSVEVSGYARHSMAHVVEGSRDVDLLFQLGRGAATLEGVVVGAGGQPRDDAEVIVTRRAGNDVAKVEAITYSDDAGRFRVEHLRDSEYDVLVWTGSTQSRHPVRTGGNPVRIEVSGR
jgi:hypothetical protein